MNADERQSETSGLTTYHLFLNRCFSMTTNMRAAARSGHTPKIDAAVESDRVEVSVDPGKLAPGRYEAILRFWTWHGANNPKVQVSLLVE